MIDISYKYMIDSTKYMIDIIIFKRFFSSSFSFCTRAYKNKLYIMLDIKTFICQSINAIIFSSPFNVR